MTTTAPTGQADRLWRAIMRLIWVESKHLAQILAAHDLTVPQFFTLQAICRRDSGCRMGDLAHTLFQSSATTTGVVDRLVEHGLVTRDVDPADRRAIQVRVTERGSRLIDEVARSQRADVGAALERIDSADRDELLRLVHLYLEALEGNVARKQEIIA